MKCSYKGNNVFKLEDGSEIAFIKWITSIKGNQYFIASDHSNSNAIYHILDRDKNNSIVKIEKVR